MKNIALAVLGVCIVLLPTKPVSALDFGVDAHAGTMGMGVGAALQLSRRVNLRVGMNEYEYDIDIDDADGLDYDAVYDMSNQYAMFDFYPSRNGSFHISLGVYLNDNEGRGDAEVVNDGTLTLIGETEAAIGTTANANVNFDSEVGYAGIGWGNTFAKGLVHFGLDLGVVFQGSPGVTLDVNLSPDLQTQCDADPALSGCISDDDIALEEQQIEDEFSDYDIYPLIQVTVGFSF